jgi:hypothetical protein
MRRLLVAILALLCGCKRYHAPENASPLRPQKRDHIVAFVLDTSGSFLTEMFGKNPHAYRFFLRASDELLRDRRGPDDKILMTQLSAESKSLLWEGTPLELRRCFGSSQRLQQFLTERSNPRGTRAYAAIATTLEYICNLPGVSQGETGVCVIVLSDMEDNSPTQSEDRQEMVNALTRLHNAKGDIGFYFVDQTRLRDCRQALEKVGVKDPIVECGIVQNPRLPKFRF